MALLLLGYCLLLLAKDVDVFRRDGVGKEVEILGLTCDLHASL